MVAKECSLNDGWNQLEFKLGIYIWNVGIRNVFQVASLEYSIRAIDASKRSVKQSH